MCVIEKMTDIYPDHVRTRRTIYRCSFSDGNDLCSRTRIHDLGEFLHGHPPTLGSQYSGIIPGSQAFIPVGVDSRRGHQNGPSRSTRRLAYKDIMRIFYLPFTRRSPREARNELMQSGQPRGDAGNTHPQREPQLSQRASEIFSHGPALHSSLSPVEIFPAPSTERPSPSSPPTTGWPRRPRERSPVIERVPLGRQPSSPVIVHNRRPEQDSMGESSTDTAQVTPASRHVHFADPVEPDEEIHDILERDPRKSARSGRRQRHLAHQELHRVRQLAEDTMGERRDIEDRTARFHRFIDRNSPSQPFVQQVNRTGHVPELPRRTPPRVIQEGARQLSEEGARIIADARARHMREEILHDFPGREGRRSRDYHFWS